jgi:von Willebrand factor type A domain
MNWFRRFKHENSMFIPHFNRRYLIYSLLCLTIFLFTQIFSVNAQDKPTLNSPANWVFMVDTSGSMVGGKGKQGDVLIIGKDIFEEIRTNLKEVVKEHPQSNSIFRIYSFNETTTLIKEVTIKTELDQQEVIDTIDNIPRPKGYETTCLSAAVNMGKKAASQLTLANSLPTNLVVVTDGFDSPLQCDLMTKDGEKLPDNKLDGMEYFRMETISKNSQLYQPKKAIQIPVSSQQISLNQNSTVSTTKPASIFDICVMFIEAILKIAFVSFIIHFPYLMVVKFALKERSQDMLGGTVAKIFNIWLDVMQGKATKFQISMISLLHVIPASLVSALLWNNLTPHILIIDTVLAGLALLFFLLRK